MDIYSKWSDENKELEKAYLDHFDPLVWRRASIQFSKEINYNVRFRKEGGDYDELTENETSEFWGSFDSTRRYMMRFFRYMSSETLLLLLIGGQKNFPMIAVTSQIKGEELNKIFKDLSKRRVPERFRWYDSEGDFSFDRWVSLKALGLFNRDLETELIDFIVSEAELLKNRDMINALKHGRAFPCEASPSLEVDFKDGDGFTKILSSKPGLAAHGVMKKAIEGDTLFAPYETHESVDADEDFQSIFVSSLFSDGIAKIRRQLIAGEKRISYQFPSDFLKITPVQRLKFDMVF